MTVRHIFCIWRGEAILHRLFWHSAGVVCRFMTGALHAELPGTIHGHSQATDPPGKPGG
jgi:hypothetical protein